MLTAVALSVLVLAGCGASTPELDDASAQLPVVSTEGFEDVTAELDYDTGTATTPISRYIVNQDFKTEVLFSQARETLISRCMDAAGFAYPGLTSVDWGSLRPMEDRLFGQWDRAAAAQFGVDLDPNRGTPKSNLVEEGPEFNTALSSCNQQAMQDATLGPLAMKLSELTLADRILANAANLAQQSEAGKRVTELNSACLSARSIVVDPESGGISVEYSELGKEAEIEAVLAEVDCNLETGRIETLYTLRAQYESAYIEKYESQLAQVLEVKQADYELLKGIIEGAA